tara:strand:- start:906 stop:1313 length:408 start_codon:yes stop_codon:yes gene_type:complete
MKKIIIYVEKHADGTYWGSSQNIPGGITAFGNTLSSLKTNLQDAYQDYYDLAVELEENYAKDLYKDVVFTYKLDLQSVFELVPEIKISNIAEKANINASLLRQYKTGKVTASEEQADKVLTAIHKLGNELLSVSF